MNDQLADDLRPPQDDLIASGSSGCRSMSIDAMNAQRRRGGMRELSRDEFRERDQLLARVDQADDADTYRQLRDELQRFDYPDDVVASVDRFHRRRLRFTDLLERQTRSEPHRRQPRNRSTTPRTRTRGTTTTGRKG